MSGPDNDHLASILDAWALEVQRGGRLTLTPEFLRDMAKRLRASKPVQAEAPSDGDMDALQAAKNHKCSLCGTVGFHKCAVAEGMNQLKAGEPIASIYISPNGEREFDDWGQTLPIGRNELCLTASVPSGNFDADPLTQFIQRLNSTAYNLNKEECISEAKKLRDELAAAHSPASGVVEREAPTLASFGIKAPSMMEWGIKRYKDGLAEGEAKARAALATQPLEQKPVAWVRRHPDGALTAEFLEDAVIEPARKKSGAWVPLGVIAQPEQVAQDREALVDLIAQHLSGTYHCTRVWEAWRVGTMNQDDFEDVGESDTPAELADAILAQLSKGAAK